LALLAGLSKRTFLGKNDHPDVHFVRPSAFIVRTALFACFYPADRFLSVRTSGKTPSVRMLAPAARTRENFFLST
jgi:hypothetical protein